GEPALVVAEGRLVAVAVADDVFLEDEVGLQVAGGAELGELLDVLFQVDGPAALPAHFQVGLDELVQGDGAEGLAAGREEAVGVHDLAGPENLLPGLLEAVGDVLEQFSVIRRQVAEAPGPIHAGLRIRDTRILVRPYSLADGTSLALRERRSSYRGL